MGVLCFCMNRRCKTVDVSEDGHGNTYIVRVISENEDILIGVPLNNQNLRIRVEKDDDLVRFLRSIDELDRTGSLREAKLMSIRDKTPSWVKD